MADAKTMAEAKEKDQGAPGDAAKRIAELEAQLAARDKAAAARAAQEDAARIAAPQSATVPGGRYEVNGVLVNAHGKQIKD